MSHAENDLQHTKIPYGSWPSPIDALSVAGKTPRLSEPKSCIIEGEVDVSIFWLQSLPNEKGRTTIMRQQLGEEGNASPPISIIPHPINIQSKAHEYGGGAYCVTPQAIYFVVGDDQRIYALKHYETTPVAITPESNSLHRYADLTFDSSRNAIFAVRENHTPSVKKASLDPTAELMLVNASATILKQKNKIDTPKVLQQNADFYSNPTVSPCGNYLAWLCWQHPNMPWDATELWVAKLDKQGQIEKALCMKKTHHDASVNESIFQPRWANNGSLFCVSDVDNWWNIYRLDQIYLADFFRKNKSPHASDWTNITSLKDAECGLPQWVFGMSTYDFLDTNTVFFCYTQAGTWRTGIVLDIHCEQPSVEKIHKINNTYTDVSAIHCIRGVYQPNTDSNKRNAIKHSKQSTHIHRAVFIGANAFSPPGVVTWEREQSKLTELGKERLTLNPSYISQPQSFSFKTGEIQMDTAHGL